MAKNYNLKAKIVAKLRQLYMYYPPRNEALKRAKVDRDHYLCEKCKKVFFRGSVHVDHKVPVVSPSGFMDWNEYIERLFCSVDNLVILCVICHREKTNSEREVRLEKKRAMAATSKPNKKGAKSAKEKKP